MFQDVILSVAQTFCRWFYSSVGKIYYDPSHKTMSAVALVYLQQSHYRPDIIENALSYWSE